MTKTQPPEEKKEESLPEGKEFEYLPLLGIEITSPKEEKYWRELCRYTFSNVANPGSSHTFTYGKLKNREYITKTLEEGGVYWLPRFLAKHLESVATPVYTMSQPEIPGVLPKLTKTSYRSRFQLRPVF